VPYDTGPTRERYPFVFATPDEPELCELRERYRLELLVAGSDSDLEKVRCLCTWVHALWQHDGWNRPSAPDALTILAEAAAGASFRCVEYSVVTAASAAALGLPSRVLELKTADAETREHGAGHVAAEVFLPDLGRWVLVDSQWGVIPTHAGTPLSGLELRLALDSGAAVASSCAVSEATVHDYLTWIGDYLFYFSVQLDNRSFGPPGGAKLMLGPTGVEAPTVFQRRFPILDTRYTRSARAFYPQP